MSKPGIQDFTEDGTWVKPPGAVRAEVTLKGGAAGIAPWLDRPGTEGATVPDDPGGLT